MRLGVHVALERRINLLSMRVRNYRPVDFVVTHLLFPFFLFFCWKVADNQL